MGLGMRPPSMRSRRASCAALPCSSTRSRSRWRASCARWLFMLVATMIELLSLVAVVVLLLDFPKFGFALPLLLGLQLVHVVHLPLFEGALRGRRSDVIQVDFGTPL